MALLGCRCWPLLGLARCHGLVRSRWPAVLPVFFCSLFFWFGRDQAPSLVLIFCPFERIPIGRGRHPAAAPHSTHTLCASQTSACPQMYAHTQKHFQHYSHSSALNHLDTSASRHPLYFPHMGHRAPSCNRPRITARKRFTSFILQGSNVQQKHGRAARAGGQPRGTPRQPAPPPGTTNQLAGEGRRWGWVHATAGRWFPWGACR